MRLFRIAATPLALIAITTVGLTLACTTVKPAPAEDDVSPVVAAKGFGQWSDTVGYGVVVQNPGSRTVTGLRYEVRFFDTDNILQDSESGTVPPVPSGGRMGVADSLIAKVKITQMQVLLTSGRATSDIAVAPVAAEPAHYESWGNDLFPGRGEIVGTLGNTGARDAIDLSVAAIAFDDQGQVVTGDSRSVAVVPAEGRAAVRILVYASRAATATITHVELFPTPLWSS